MTQNVLVLINAAQLAKILADLLAMADGWSERFPGSDCQPVCDNLQQHPKVCRMRPCCIRRSSFYGKKYVLAKMMFDIALTS